MAQAQIYRVIIQSICNKEARKSKRKMLSKRNTQYHLSQSLKLAIIFCLHIVSVWATSMGSAEEEVKPKLSFRDEIRSMQTLPRNKNTNLTQGKYMLDLLAKSNPELEDANGIQYFLSIYKKKEYADLDVSKYSMEDIQYRIVMPMGVHSLRILDSSTEQDEPSKRKCNRVFIKLLYSFSRLQFAFLVIEGIKIGLKDQELLEFQDIKNFILKAGRLVFRNVTTETIRVFFNRMNKASVGRLCIEDCGIIKLDDAVTMGSRYEIGGLELKEVKIAPNSHQAFLGRVSHIEHLMICRVQFIYVQVLKSLLFMLKGTLEIDLGVYKQVPEAIWAIYANRIRQLHLMNLGHLASIEEELRDTSPAFSSLTILTLSVKHSQMLEALLLSSVIIQVKKYYGGVKNVVILGKMNMEEVKKAIRDKESGIAQTLQEHANIHFTFIDSTGIDLSRKHLLFIPLSVYNETTTVKDLGNRLGVLGEISNWDWNKQKGQQVLCTRCKAKKEGYVIQAVNGGVVCDYNMRYNIQRQENISTDADKNVYLKNMRYKWYPKSVIFLSQELDGQAYLAEVRDIIEEAKKHEKRLILAGKPKTKRTMRFTLSTNAIQDSAIDTSMTSKSTIEQQSEPQPGTSGYVEKHISEPTYYTPSQPSAVKQSRYEPAASNWSTLEQPVRSETQKMAQPQSIDTITMYEQVAMGWNKELQTHNIEKALEKEEQDDGYIEKEWLDKMIEELTEGPETQEEMEQSQIVDTIGELPVVSDEDLETCLGLAAGEAGEFLWDLLNSE